MKRGGGMDDDIKWVLGIALTLMLFVGTTIRVMFVNLSAKIAKTHERIDDVKDNYVRRDDLDARLDPLVKQVDQLRDDMNRNSERLVAEIRALKSDK